MKYFHPAFMLVLFALFFKVRSIALEALAVNPKSPDADQRDALIAKHGKFGITLIILFVGGFIGGIVGSVKFLHVSQPFMQSYGHAFIGIMILALLVTQIFLGKSIKNIKVPKIKKRFFSFHKGIFTFVIIMGILSLVTGAIVLISGPSAL